MIKNLTICLITSFFALLPVSSASAKVTISSEYKYKVLQDTGTAKSCEDQGYLSSCPTYANCSSKKGGCWAFIQCISGYVLLDGVCTLNNCSDYPLTDCNDNKGTVEKCKTDTSKCKYTGCGGRIGGLCAFGGLSGK